MNARPVSNPLNLAFVILSTAVPIVGQVSETVTHREAHQSVVVSVSAQVDDQGAPVEVQHRYVQIEDGLNYWDEESGQWAQSRAEIELVKGVGVARRGPQQVVFAPNLNDEEGSITLTAGEGVLLRSSLLALTYYDAWSGREVVLATVKDAIGQFLPPNRLVYRDAFEGLQADVVYTYRKSGLEQDVILLECPPDPEDLGLLAETTRLEVFTEFFEAPNPEIRPRVLDRVEDAEIRAAMVEPDWVDEELDFGPFWMGAGRALSLDEWETRRSTDAGIEIGKRWVQQDGRTVLVESADYWLLASQLTALPVRDGTPRRFRQAGARYPGEGVERRLAASGREIRGGGKVTRGALPQRRMLVAGAGAREAQGSEGSAGFKEQEITLASASPAWRPGVVLDYVTISGTRTDQVFRSDTTYYVSGPATMNGSTVTFEGGTVIKYGAGVSAGIGVGSATKVVWRGAMYRPVVLTAKDDHGVGEKIGTATTCSGYYATTALALVYNATYGAFDLPWLRVSHAQNGVSVTGGSGHALRHFQAINCGKGVVAGGVGNYAVRNALFQGVGNALSGSATVTAEHLTVNGGSLRDMGQPAVTLKNSLLTGVGDVGTLYGADSQVLGSSTGIFASAQQGAHYLAAGSPYRNWSAALSTIDATLLQDLRRLSTYPPLILTGNITVNTTLAPQAQRDTDLLDLGFHYAPLDWIGSARSVGGGCTLMLTNGVAVGSYGNYMISLSSSTAKLVSEGTPRTLNWLTLVGAAQEQPTTASASLYLVSIANVQVALRFTGVSLPGGRKIVPDGGFSGGFSLQDCQVAGLAWYLYSYGFNPSVVLKNSLFESCNLRFEQGYSGTPYNLALSVRNCLMRDTPLNLWYSSSYYGTWELHDNLFDGVTFTLVPANGSGIPADRNGYTGVTGPTGWTNNKNSLSRDFVGGPLGSYYYPASGGAPSLASLIDGDATRTPATVGLYHYTTVVAAGGKEATTALDIGFHYAGVNGGAQPIDTDGDGLADYFEDRNGNGAATPDAGETDWDNVYNSPNGLTGTPGLQVLTPLR